MVAFTDIKLTFRYDFTTYFPMDKKEFLLGELIDALLIHYKITKETILKKMKYTPCYYDNDKWISARSKDKGLQQYDLCLINTNEPFYLIDQQDPFVLKFMGQDVVWGRLIEVNTFEELLELSGLRKAFIAPYTTTSGIPKRLDSNLFRF